MAGYYINGRSMSTPWPAASGRKYAFAALEMPPLSVCVWPVTAQGLRMKVDQNRLPEMAENRTSCPTGPNCCSGLIRSIFPR